MRLCFWLIYRLSTFTTLRAVYLSLGILWLSIAASVFGYSLFRSGLAWKKALAFTLGISVLSWPIYFSFERGNIESFLWLMLAAALALYIRKHWQLAAVGIGFIAAFKIYPILFLGLFLPARRYREIGEALLALVLTTLAGLFFLDPNVLRAASFTRQGIKIFLNIYSAQYLIDANGYDHSAWALLKYPLRFHPVLIRHGVSIYTLTAGLLATWFYFARVWKAPRLNQLLAICTLMVLLPSTSFDYTLQAMYIPFAWLCVETLRARRLGGSIPGASAFFVAFGLIFGPLVFFRGRNYIVNGQVKTLVLVYLLYLAVRVPLTAGKDPSEAELLARPLVPSTAIPS